MDWLQEHLQKQRENKERLEKMFPNHMLKDISLGFLKKIGHILEIPSYSSLNKRELIYQVLTTQKKYRQEDSETYDAILYYTIKGGVCCELSVNEDCRLYYYIIDGKKYK